MVTFHAVFATALVYIGLSLIASKSYVQLIRAGMAIAIVPAVKQALLKNKHHRESAQRALKEYEIHTMFRLPLTYVSLAVVGYAYIEGLMNAGVLSSLTITLLVLILTPLVAYNHTKEHNPQWLFAWTAGLQAVLVSVQIEVIKKRIDELEAIANIEEIEELHQELLNLREAYDAFRMITEIQAEQQQSGGEG
jgi:mannose/fructose/N-acetylgalactosamine-specific phosphotransferase system component IID